MIETAIARAPSVRIAARRGAAGARLAAFVALAFVAAVGPARALTLQETPSLEPLVDAGTLPPVDQRVPEEPLVVDFAKDNKEVGRSGGDLTILLAKPKDIRQMTVYGYARLICYDENFNLVPDILESFDVKEGRIFTFRLRKGHKWSDGEPFTVEDFRYYWEDVVNNPDVSPFGLPQMLLVDGEAPKFEILDDLTVRYSWSKPNPELLPWIANAAPIYLYRPAHYLKQFHARYADKEKLEEMVEESGQRNWAALHNRKDRQYRFDNPDLPVLQPWINTTQMPSERFVFARNPYYHRVDPQGRQLPYLDNVIVKIADSKIIPAKTGAGESDLQARNLRFDDYPFLKEGETRHDYHTYLWDKIKGAQIALFPNLNANDDGWRELLRDVRFRHALSLAIDRNQINQVIYYGLARISNDTVLPRSPLFKEEYQTLWTQFDLKKANWLLDEMGLTQRNSEGTRLMADGRPLEIIVDTSGESTEETDVLQLIGDTWRKIGIKLYARPSQREVFRNRVFSGEAIMSTWSGVENAAPTADFSPREFVPYEQHQLQWPKFGQYYETEGQAGEPPDMPKVQRLAELGEAWHHTIDEGKRRQIWEEILKIHAEETYMIGIVNGVPQPVVVNDKLRNVPEKGIYNWDPGAYFGVYKPDTFWFTEPRRGQAASLN
jgi:peptide/nickel transport system substrate-binding protein